METTSDLFPGERNSARRDASAQRFFDTLRREHLQFLDAVGRARSALGRESGQLAHITAIQTQLTRQFFDAQYAIMQRRAQVDAEVAAIGRAADDLALAMVGTAREQVAAGLTPRLLHPSAGSEFGSFALPAEASRSTRQEIAALGVAVVTTKDEADALAVLLEDAFKPDEPDGAAAARQMAAMLERWWAAEQQEGNAVIDDAHARAMMRTHVAELEAREILLAAQPAQAEQVDQPDTSLILSTAPAPLVPSPVAIALQSVGLTERQQSSPLTAWSSCWATPPPRCLRPAPQPHRGSGASGTKPTMVVGAAGGRRGRCWCPCP